MMSMRKFREFCLKLLIFLFISIELEFINISASAQTNDDTVFKPNTTQLGNFVLFPPMK